MNSTDSTTVRHWIKGMAHQLREELAQTLDEAVIVGIHTGGVNVAAILHESLSLNTPLCELNINFYRDDFSQIGLHPSVGASKLPTNIDDKTIILVDDVIYSGRTIRAAMNELFDFGRPSRIILAVLVQREGRELPIRPDIVGQSLSLTPNSQIKLQGQDMSLLIIDTINPGDHLK